MVDSLATIIAGFPGEANRSRCLAHIVNLVVKIILRQFDLTKKKVKKDVPVDKDSIADEDQCEFPGDDSEDVVDKMERVLDKEEKEMDEGGEDDDEDGETLQRNIEMVEKALEDSEEIKEVSKLVKPVRQVLYKVCSIFPRLFPF